MQESIDVLLADMSSYQNIYRIVANCLHRLTCNLPMTPLGNQASNNTFNLTLNQVSFYLNVAVGALCSSSNIRNNIGEELTNRYQYFKVWQEFMDVTVCSVITPLCVRQTNSETLLEWVGNCLSELKTTPDLEWYKACAFSIVIGKSCL